MKKVNLIDALSYFHLLIVSVYRSNVYIILMHRFYSKDLGCILRYKILKIKLTSIMLWRNIRVIRLARQGMPKVTSPPPTELVLEEVNTSRLAVSPLA